MVILGSLTAPGFIAPANALVCSAAGSNVSMTALHRASGSGWGAANYKPFYADIKGGVSGKTSSYAGYAIDGSLVSGVADLWIKLSGFSSNIGLATNQAAAVPVRDKYKNTGGIEDATKRVAYFFLSTSYSGNDSTADETFTIQLFNGNPNLGGSELCNATDGFSGIIDTLSASANKVTSVTTTATTAVLGSNFTLTAVGQTGTMGAGDSSDQVSVGRDDFGPFVISPSITNTWDANAFNLVGVSYVIDTNNNGFLTDETTFYNELRYYPNFTSNRKYQVVYYFAARKVAASTLFQPVQNIASGTQVKYTGTYSGTASSTSISIVKGSLSLNKALLSVATSTLSTNTIIDVSYRLTIKNNSSVTSLFDYVQDQVTLNADTTGGAFISPTNGATVTLDGTSSISPTTKASISGSVLSLNFNGPISLTSGQTSNIDYTVRVSYPTANASMPINNTATGYVGTESVSASAGVNAVSVDIKLTQTLIINYAANGHVTVDAKQVDGSTCTSSGLSSGSVTCTFYKGTALTLTAVSASSAISSWGTTANGSASNTGNCTTSNANSPCTLVIQANSTIIPTFNTSYTVTVTGVSNVVVSDSGLPYTCSAGTCTKTYADGATPSLTFTPDTGYTISSITSNAASPSTATFPNTSSGSLLVKSNFTITVSAALPQYGLDVTASDGGSVSSGGGFITSCSSDANGATGTCGALINAGTSVTLTATVSAGNYFGGWSGDGSCTGTSLTCTFTMNQNRNVVATFTSSPSLAVTVVGSGSVSAGSGAVSGCDSTGIGCSGSYTLNSSVTLTATIPAGNSVTWSGACSGSNSTCVVTMNSSKAVTATFAVTTYTITVSSGSNGSISPGTATYNYGATQAFTITPNTGYKIDTITVNSSSVSVTNSGGQTYTFSSISANNTIAATFALNSFTFAYNGNTSDGGSTPSGGGSKNYNSTVTVASNTFTKSDHRFANWHTTSGGTGGTSYSATDTFNMPASNVTLYAQWTRVYTITLGTITRVAGDSTSTVNISTSPSASGETVTLNLSPKSGMRFKSGTLVANSSFGNASLTASGGSAFTFTMPAADVTVTAEFEAVPAGSYSVTINSATGGSANTSDATVTSGGSVTLTATASTGYVFSSWNCTGGGTLSSSTTNPATLSNITADASCTPVFSVVYTVTFNGNSGSGTASSATLTQASSGASITLATVGSLALSNSGFMGWSIAPSNGTVLVAGTSYTPTSSLTVYAQWVTTNAASSVGTSTATLNGSTTSPVTSAAFCYSSTVTDLSTCTSVSASGSYSANLTGLSTNTTYYYRIVGTINSTAYNGAILTFTTSTSSPTTYTITASAGSNGSISPSGSVTVNSGENQSFTITANSGYEIDVLTVNSSPVSTVTTYTFTNVTSNQSISVIFKTVTSGNRGNSSGRASSNRNVKIIVQKVSVGTTGTSSGQTITPSSRGTTATTGGQINALTNNTQSANASNNGAVVEAVNTTSTTSIVVDKNVPSSVAIERAADNKVNVQGINGWTGRVSVAVVDENDPTEVQSFIEVAINPLPVSKVTVNEANTVKEKKISFDPSPSEVVKYQVLVNNKIACESTTTSCALPQLVGPKSKVEIVAIGNDETRSIPEPFKIEYKKPIVALVVNFPVASSALSSRYRADLRGLARVLIREGFTRIQVDGHTDTQGVNIGYNNQALSDARSRATRAYLQRLVPGLKFVTSANSYRTPVADNVTPEGQFTNRRAEVKVW